MFALDRISERDYMVHIVRLAGRSEDCMRRLALIVMAGLLSGCGGGADTPESSPAAADSGGSAVSEDRSGCELLTDAEVGQATAATITGHEEYSLNGCRWRSEGMDLMLDLYTGSSLIPSTCDAQQALGGGQGEAVPGLGDSARWKAGGALIVCSPRAVIRFNMDSSPRSGSDDKEALVELARLALGRLSE